MKKIFVAIMLALASCIGAHAQSNGQACSPSGAVFNTPGGQTLLCSGGVWGIFQSAPSPLAVPNPLQVASVAPTASPQTNPQTIYTTPADGNRHLYMICGFITVTAAGTAGTVYPAYTFTAGGHTFAGADMLTGSATISVTTQWNANGACNTVIADPGTPIQAWMSISGITGSPAYLFGVTLHLLV